VLVDATNNLNTPLDHSIANRRDKGSKWQLCRGCVFRGELQAPLCTLALSTSGICRCKYFICDSDASTSLTAGFTASMGAAAQRYTVYEALQCCPVQSPGADIHAACGIQEFMFA